MSAQAFLYCEARVAQHVGLSRDAAKLLRRQLLREGVDWTKKNREVALNLSAIKKLWRSLHNPPDVLNLSVCEFEKKNGASERLALPEPVTAARPATLIVKRIYENPRVLMALDDAGREVQVIVMNNTNFVPAMTLPAIPSKAQQGYYELVGPLPPRRGRWF